MSCIFSDCRRYRYTLEREVPVTLFLERFNVGRTVAFIGLNPSTADETRNDPTVRKCIGFASRWGFGSLVMLNLFGWRDTDPANMKKRVRPVGADNLYHIGRVSASAGRVVAAWGTHGDHIGQDKIVLGLLDSVGVQLHCLGVTDGGFPRHPLYVPYERQLVPFPQASSPKIPSENRPVL